MQPSPPLASTVNCNGSWLSCLFRRPALRRFSTEAPVATSRRPPIRLPTLLLSIFMALFLIPMHCTLGSFHQYQPKYSVLPSRGWSPRLYTTRLSDQKLVYARSPLFRIIQIQTSSTTKPPVAHFPVRPRSLISI
ncbi:hypothetical protein BOTBODRAFT_35336 [Botryobasidium botryosum FD-172 SS1]|uniref:Uncharacterized protein n=1 Tax=Botryobasidium botryosum (strain FD-172 SS1) TaxID=930990 RepID=A0A067M6R2_BOTB1|nr:hypothetical protein BOTBODRAFT_35336 [Botryobasidium botryosum FD-172 SS1]